MQADPTINPADKRATTSSSLADVLLMIGRERQWLMESLREALLGGDDAKALEREGELLDLPSQKSPISAVTT